MKITQNIRQLAKKEKAIVIFLALLIGISFIPLLLISRYNVMAADDYAMGKVAHQIWIEKRNVWDMVCYAFTHTLEIYQNWQGCYTINFLDSLNPGFFGEEHVWITAILMLLAITLFLYLFISTVLKKYYNANIKHVFMIATIFIFLVVQTMPSPVEGIYWYSGAIAYTFSHYFCLTFYCLFLWRPQTKKTVYHFLYMVLLMTTGLVVGGCQYVTVLECLIWILIYIICDYKHFRWTYIVGFVSVLIGFLVNLLAPGNFTRRLSANGMNPVWAILRSFAVALSFMKEWLSPLFIVVLLFLIPFIWKVVKSSKKSYNYRYPLIVMLISYCVFSSCFTAPLYGVGNIDAGRIQNQIQVLYYLIVFINFFYLTGWLQNKLDVSSKEVYIDIKNILYILGKYETCYKWIMMFCIVLILFATGDKNTFSSVSGFRSLINKEAEIYYNEAQERLIIYEDRNITVAEVKSHSVKPKLLYFNDVQEEDSVDYWINENIAAYYGKQLVILK